MYNDDTLTDFSKLLLKFIIQLEQFLRVKTLKDGMECSLHYNVSRPWEGMFALKETMNFISYDSTETEDDRIDGKETSIYIKKG